MIDAPVQPTTYVSEKVVEVIENFQHDEFGYFLENDPELDMAYGACLRAAGIEWTDEEVAEAVFRQHYGDKIDDLMQYWRFQQSLKAGDSKAIAVHNAVGEYMRLQAY